MHHLGKIRSGEKVIDRTPRYFQSGMEKILPDLFARITSRNKEDKNFIVEEIDMWQIIGKRIVVLTTKDDEIVYAQRVGREGLSRFVKYRQPIPSSKAVVILKWDDEKVAYVLITAYVGDRHPHEPWNKHATPHSKTFWDTHAFIMGEGYEIVPGTETEDCPW